MEMIAFTVVGILAYLAADRLLEWFEVRRGSRFEHRTLIFFVLLLVLALGAFQLINLLVAPSTP